MINIVYSNKASEDLTSIWNYSSKEWSEQQAEKYYLEIIDHCNDISKNYHLGKDYSEIYYGLKGLNVKKHIIFYRQISEDLIEITRILHGRMDLKKRYYK